MRQDVAFPQDVVNQMASKKNHNNYYYGVPRECSYLQLKPVSEYPVYIPFQNGTIDCLQCGCVHIEIVHS